MRLFYVDTFAPEFLGNRNVNIRWLYEDRRTAPPVPYQEAIKGYAGPDQYPESAVDELFTEEEAEALRRYLDNFPGQTTISGAALPFPRDSMGLSMIPLGGPQRDYDLSGQDAYPLSFKVRGYYDLRNSDLPTEQETDPGPSLFDDEGAPPPPPDWMLRRREAGEPSAEFEAAVSQMRAALANCEPFLPASVHEALKEAAGRLAIMARDPDA